MKAEELKFSDIDRLIVDNIDQGEFWVHRDLYRDPAVFELEMKYIFERNWVFVGLESQARLLRIGEVLLRNSTQPVPVYGTK